MNGRCETDPLDRAVDVCDRCFGEFCETHLLRPKGRKHPFCNDCALSASGVRGSGKVELRGDRRTAKQRRKQLREAEALDDEHVFEFFEYEPDDEDAPTPELEPAAEDDTAADEPERPVDSDDDSDQRGSTDPIPFEDTPATPAVAELAKLRREAEERANRTESESPNSSEPAPPAAIPAAAQAGDTKPPPPHRPLPNRQSTRPPVPAAARVPVAGDGEPGDDGTDDTAADERAADRRRSMPTPKQRRPTAPMIGEVRNITGRRVDDQPPGAGAGRAGTELARPEAGGALNAVDGFDADRQQDEPNATPKQHASHGLPPATGGGMGIDANPDDTSTLDRRDAPGTKRPDSNTSVGTSGSGNGDSAAKRADVDDRGNWIPPILRGIAADAGTAKDNLPHRSRR